nr:uncharacterized protein LOC112428703 [Macaca nemestrina]
MPTRIPAADLAPKKVLGGWVATGCNGTTHCGLLLPSPSSGLPPWVGLAIVLLEVVQAAHKGHSRAVRNRGCLLGWPARRGKGRNCNRSGEECEGAAGAGAGGGAELGRVLAGPASRSDLPPARQGPGGVDPQAREAESAGGQAWGLGHDCRTGVLGAPGDLGAEHPNTEEEVRAQPGAGRRLRGAACTSLTVAPTSSAPLPAPRAGIGHPGR